MRSAIKLAYGSIPKDCGTFTFYRQLRAGLLAHGVEMFCVSVGKQEAALWNPAFADDHCVQLAVGSPEVSTQAKAFVKWAQAERVDFVMPINSTPILSAIPHLPAKMQVVMRCANAFEQGYRITVLEQARVARIVATTPRHIEDLTTKYAADPGKLTLIPHGIETYPAVTRRHDGKVLTLAFLGRLEHMQKGALYLPGIVQKLEKMGVPFQLKIAGAGEHRGQMEILMADAISEGRVKFVGRLEPHEVPAFLFDVDVFLFPSRFEGFGFSLVEAMMAGCVPVASKIVGITDFIIEEGRTGLLCPIGDEAAFASAIARLHNDRSLLASLSGGASDAARERFNSARMAENYAKVFDTLQAEPFIKPEPLPWSKFRLPAPLRSNWSSKLPRPIRKLARKLLTTFGLRKTETTMLRTPFARLGSKDSAAMV